MSTSQDITFDFQREQRLGFPEIVYGEHKSIDQLQRIVAMCGAQGQDILISRCQAEKAACLADGHYDPVARTWMHRAQARPAGLGRVAVVSGGTADAPVVAECANTLDFLGIATLVVQDVGVAAIHRLLSRLEELLTCDVVVCVAGFEGALASVVSGQVPQPVIGVPTSVGYGVAANGEAALRAMLASCANGLMVMNIDNGVGAALAARRILNTKKKSPCPSSN